MRLEQASANVSSREGLANFVGRLAEDLELNPDSWENADLRSYLEGLRGWIMDVDGYFENRGETAPPEPSWQLMATILLAARVYE